MLVVKLFVFVCVSLIAAGLVLPGTAHAADEASHLKVKCVEGICPGDAQQQLDATHSLGNAALAGIIVGGMGMAAGASRLQIGMGTVGVGGRF